MKNAVTSIKNIVTKTINFVFDIAPAASVFVGLTGIAAGVVTAPAALTVIGTVFTVSVFRDLCWCPGIMNCGRFAITGLVVRSCGMQTVGRVVCYLVAAKVVAAVALFTIGGLLLIGGLVAIHFTGGDVASLLNVSKPVTEAAPMTEAVA